VTFLAFGNGSPDLFSTLSAMRAGSGSLAIGELIGAASFIVSVVAGSMCIIQSFHVNPVPFVRDVGFFTVSMAALFCILWDGLIKAWEAALLAGLYVIYVIVVIGSTWWDKRRERKQRCLEEARRAFVSEPVPSIAIYLDNGPYRDNRK
jgi:sodium/potassium/calcium exchanger 6